MNRDGMRVLLLARARAREGVTADDLADPAAVDGVRAVALVVLEQRLRPDAADTLRYFAEQDVSAKVISGDNAVSVGAVAGKLGLSGTTVDALAGCPPIRRPWA